MKKLLLITSIIFVSASTFAQQRFIGFQTGINMTNVSSDNFFSDSKSRTGINIGFKYEVIKDQLSLSADLLYNQHGFSDEINSTNQFGDLVSVDDVENNFDYLSVPLKIGYVLGNKLTVTPKIGLQPSILVSAKIIVPVYDNNGLKTGERSEDVSSDASSFDLAALLELELGYSLNENMAIFGSLAARRSITEISNSDFFPSSKLKNTGVAISVGLKYNISSK